MDEVINPYRPGAGTPPPALVGRDSLIEQFHTVLLRARHGRLNKSLMATGLRGVGKTVLLQRFQALASEEGFEVAQIEIPEDQAFRELLASRLRKVLLTLNRRRPTQKVLKALRILKAFTISLPDGSTFSLDVEPLVGFGDSGYLEDDITELFVALGEAVQSVDTGCLVALDEVQYLRHEELAALITAIHRVMQLDLPVVICGAGLPQLPGLAGKAKSYAERLFEFPVISSLQGGEAVEALRIPAQKEGVEFEPEVLRAAVARSGGYPYFLQEWGYHLWNEALESPITLDVLDRAVSEVIRRLDQNFFRVRFDRLTPKERDYLRAMAKLGPGPHRSGDIARVLGVKVESVAPRRSGLIGKGMIYSPAHGDTAFTVPLFDDFLKRELPDWTPVA